jgi:hypothetical protein
MQFVASRFIVLFVNVVTKRMLSIDNILIRCFDAEITDKYLILVLMNSYLSVLVIQGDNYSP